MRTGDYDGGEQMAEDAVELARTLDDQSSADALELAAAAAFPRGIAPWARGDFEHAQQVIEESLAACLAAGQVWYTTQLEYLLARVLRDTGDLTAAETVAARALSRAGELGEDQVLGLCADLSASLARRRGELESARSLAADALVHYRATGYQEGEASAVSEAGRLALDAGDAGAATAAFAQALVLFRRMGHRAGVAAAIEGHARVLGVVGDASGAAALWGGASALRRQIGAPLPAVEQAEQERELRRLAQMLGADAVDLALTRGATLSLDALAELSASGRLAGV